jgi:hypothetical protein
MSMGVVKRDPKRPTLGTHHNGVMDDHNNIIKVNVNVKRDLWPEVSCYVIPLGVLTTKTRYIIFFDPNLLIATFPVAVFDMGAVVILDDRLDIGQRASKFSGIFLLFSFIEDCSDAKLFIWFRLLRTVSTGAAL